MARADQAMTRCDQKSLDRESEQIAIDGGLSVLPDELRKLTEFLALRTDQLCHLDAGKTALFWDLVGTVGRHIRARKP